MHRLLCLLLLLSSVPCPAVGGSPGWGLPSSQGAGNSVQSRPRAGDYLFSLVGSLSREEQSGSTGGVKQLLATWPRAAADIRKALERLSSTDSGWLAVAAILLIFVSSAFLAAILSRTIPFRGPPEAGNDPDLMLQIWGAVVGAVPVLIRLALNLMLAAVLFALFCRDPSPPVRQLFYSLFVMVALAGTAILLATLFLSPGIAEYRFFRLSDGAARGLLRNLRVVFWFLASSLLLVVFLRHLGISRDTIRLLILVLGTLQVFLIALLLIGHRRSISRYLAAPPFSEQRGPVARQLAGGWLFWSLAYLLLVWALLIATLLGVISGGKGIYFISLCIVPVFFILERLGQWVVRTTVTTLDLYRSEVEERPDEGAAVLSGEEKEQILIRKTGSYMRLLIGGVLCLWLLSRWGYRIPLAAPVAAALFKIFVILALTLVIWKVTTTFIERKMEEFCPDDEVEDEVQDEWGGAAQRGRSYTLLPMVRKFIGSVLVVMVTMTSLSALGVDIGPLLAGAGVVGLAIGFGAQKLVSDMFSGFFYLLDDAFRVGEYLEAGGVSGTVEAITLRNVMLRHHRGMLQIVPHSELGAITNFMRGGIVVKFNLEFPYDTDIDKVRKIIKKVGQAMLQDEELGKDFIRPVKSQGVREISNSVMVIRVKFTAKPGAHFVIRREAYRRITEALNAKGIYYAHRKVIVELPETGGGGEVQPSRRVLQAAGAAALEQEKGGAAGPNASAQ